MIGMFERLGKDWAFVAGSNMEFVDLNCVKLLAGPNPKTDRGRKKLQEALGLTPPVIEVYRLLDRKHKKEADIAAGLEEESDPPSDSNPASNPNSDSDHVSESEGEEEYKPGRASPIDMDDVDDVEPIVFTELPTPERVNIYNRILSIKRPLLSPVLVTSKRKLYSAFNTLVCNVTIRSYTRTNHRFVCGAR